MVQECKVEAGETYEVECPFVRDTYTEFDAEGPAEVPTWKPGVDWEMCAPDDSEAVADGIGKVVYYRCKCFWEWLHIVGRVSAGGAGRYGPLEAWELARALADF